MTQRNDEDAGYLDLLLAAAQHYYEQDLTQAKIAESLNVSRPTVSRLLADARRLGVVRIEVGLPMQEEAVLGRELERAFGLAAVSVVAAGGREGDELALLLGRAAAAYLDTVIEDGMMIGVSNGRTLAAAARFLRQRPLARSLVVQIIGALGAENAMIDGPDVARTFATAFGSSCRYLHVPLLVRNKQIRDTLVSDPRVKRTLDLAARVDIAVVGVGSVAPTESSPLFEGLRSEQDLEEILDLGAVGHLCGEHFDSTGAPIAAPLNDRVIGVGIRRLEKIPSVVAVAGGAAKGNALLAALRGGLIDVLITDSEAARFLLSQGFGDRSVDAR